MVAVEVFVDPSCPWAWITSRWVREVASPRELDITWRSYCLEIRDDYDVAPTMPAERRRAALAAHALSHRMLRVFEAARAGIGEDAVDALYAAWGRVFFADVRHAYDTLAAGGDDALLSACIEESGVTSGGTSGGTGGGTADLLGAADEAKWDAPIVDAMDVAYAFGGPKTQTPTIVVCATPPYGFKGPVMAPAPTGDAALRLWDAITVIAREPGFFEITRPRVNPPRTTAS